MQTQARDVIGKYMGPVRLGVITVVLLLPRQSLLPDLSHRQWPVVDQSRPQASGLINSDYNRSGVASKAAARSGVKVRRPVFRYRRRPMRGCYVQRTRTPGWWQHPSQHERLCMQCCTGSTSLPTQDRLSLDDLKEELRSSFSSHARVAAKALGA